MADSHAGRLTGRVTRREALSVGAVAAALLAAHLLAPAVLPDYAVYVQYATYLLVFSVWMAWFVDWLAVWLGQDPHPSEREAGD
jgi:hypothetical protein